MECLKNRNVSSGGRPIALRVSGTPMKLSSHEYDIESEYGRVHSKHCTFQDLPSISLDYGCWIPDIGPDDNYPSYFLPFAQLELDGIVGLGLSRVDPHSLVFEREGYMRISYPKKGVKQILHFLKKQTKFTSYVV